VDPYIPPARVGAQERGGSLEKARGSQRTSRNRVSEIGFGFALSPGVIASALNFAVVMGLVGGVLPAARAARLNIVNALRAS